MADAGGLPLRELVELDLDELDLRSALTGLAVLTALVVVIGILGPAGMAAGIAALFVLAGASGDSARSWPEHIAFVVLGAAVTLVTGYAAANGPTAAIVLGLVAVASTLAALRGPVGAANGAYLLIWAVLTLSIVDAETTPPEAAAAFLGGGSLALLALWVAHRVDPEHDPPPTPLGMDRALIQRYAVVRGVGAGLCVAIGYQWFPDHASWAAFAFVLVLQPPREQTIVVGIGRTIGTVVGVLLGMAIADLVGGSEISLLVAFVACAFCMLATSNVNYAVSTTFTTALLLIAQRLIQEDLFATGWDRLLATLVGVAMAFLAITAIRLLGSQPVDH